ALDEASSSHPERREAQRALAREVCTMIHGESQARRAQEAAEALYSQNVASLDEASLLDVFSEAPSTVARRSVLGTEAAALVDVLGLTGVAKSKSSARTLLTQGGVYVNDRRVTDVDTQLGPSDLLFDRYVVLRRGKQDYHLVRFE
ncbi:MAG: S4 domain-containing protein, partial [Acidimicrobiales bacterium]